MQKTVFIIDDSEINLTIARECLKEQYRVVTMSSAEKMLTHIENDKPDIILLDIEMPGMNGFEALENLKSDSRYADIPVIFVTGDRDESIEVRGFQLGVVDFITKPFSPPVLQNRIKTHMNIDDLIRKRTIQLRKKREQLQNLQNGIVFVVADLIENRDKGTGGHVERTTTYIKILIDAMIASGVYADELCHMDRDMLISSARLHDVGKIVIPDAILNKPGKLTDEEFNIMKTHAMEGERIIDQIISRTGNNMEFLSYAKIFAGYHHERWDGKGYPRGLARTKIPLLGRIMAIVDVYDALVSERPYKKPLPPDDAIKVIMDNINKHFDPLITHVFNKIRM